jgi:hypothetical protein
MVDLWENMTTELKCQKCGYFLKQSKITSAYLEGKIVLPFRSGLAKMTM